MSKLQCAKCQIQFPASMRFCPTCRGALTAVVEPSSVAQSCTVSTGSTSNAGSPPVPTAKRSAAASPAVVGRPNGQVPILKTWGMLGLLLAVFAIALSLIKGGESVAAYVASTISVETEVELGRAAHEEVGSSVLSAGHPDSALVHEVGERLVKSLPYPSKYADHYQFRVVRSDQVNAFAAPGGAVFVYTGLLDLTNRRPDLLAAVLAHEIQHVEHQHGVKSAVQAASIGALTLWTFGLASDLGDALTGSVINTRHSRKLEREADQAGHQLLVQAGFPSSAMPEMLLTLAAAQRGHRLPSWLSSHPDADERARDATTRQPAPKK